MKKHLKKKKESNLNYHFIFQRKGVFYQASEAFNKGTSSLLWRVAYSWGLGSMKPNSQAEFNLSPWKQRSPRMSQLFSRRQETKITRLSPILGPETWATLSADKCNLPKVNLRLSWKSTHLRTVNTLLGAQGRSLWGGAQPLPGFALLSPSVAYVS